MNTLQIQLNAEDEKRFGALEAICASGRAVFFMVGTALAEIKAREFYKARGFKTFADYCESRGFSKRYGNQLIVEANVMKELPDEFRNVVQSERAARELARITPFLRPAVLEAASAGGTKPVTAGSIKKHAPPPVRPVAKVPPPRPPAPKRPEPEAPKVPEIVDGTGLPVPVEVHELWNRGSEVEEILSYVSAIKSRLKKAQEDRDPLFVEVDFVDDIAKLEQIFVDVKTAIPYAVCPSCNGKIVAGCPTCKGRGFISQFYWKTHVSEDVKKVTSRK